MRNDRREIETTFPTGGREVAAWVRLPGDPAEPVPGIVFVDGSGPSHRHHFGPHPEWFLDAGFAVLTHDKPGCGDTPGDWREQTIPGRAEDTLAALEAFRSFDEIDSERVGLWAASQGGWVAPIVAAADPRVAFMVLVASTPVTPYQQEAYSLAQRMQQAGESAEAISTAVASYWDLVGRLRSGQTSEQIAAWLADDNLLRRSLPAQVITDPGIIAHFGLIGDHDPLPAVADVRCPVLLVWGSDDPVVPVEDSRRIFLERLVASPDVTVEIFPDADHWVCVDTAGDEFQFAPGYVETTTAWARDRA